VTTDLRRRASVFLNLSSLDSVTPLIPSFGRGSTQPFCDSIFWRISKTLIDQDGGLVL
jgi:hypothetical protein